jgi:hypothetical protein
MLMGVPGLRLPRLLRSLAMTTIDIFTKPENCHRAKATGRHDSLDVRGIGCGSGFPRSLALPRNDNFPTSQNPDKVTASSPGALPSGAQHGDRDVRGVESVPECPRLLCRSAMTTSGLLAFMHHDGRL